MSYSPVRHSIPKYCVRLACIRHAASVHPEPGSNSPLSFYLLDNFCLLDSFFLSLFDVFLFSFQCPFLMPSLECSLIISSSTTFVKSFFYFFSLFLFLLSLSFLFSPYLSVFFLFYYFIFLLYFIIRTLQQSNNRHYFILKQYKKRL